MSFLYRNQKNWPNRVSSKIDQKYVLSANDYSTHRLQSWLVQRFFLFDNLSTYWPNKKINSGHEFNQQMSKVYIFVVHY